MGANRGSCTLEFNPEDVREHWVDYRNLWRNLLHSGRSPRSELDVPCTNPIPVLTSGKVGGAVMNRLLFAFLLVSASLTACGASLVPRGTDDDAATGDVSLLDGLPVGSVDTPTQSADTPTQPADTPTQPADTNAIAVPPLCASVCQRQVLQCGGVTQSCIRQCLDGVASPQGARCESNYATMLECFLREGFVCVTSGVEVVSTCRPVFEAFRRCFTESP